MIHNISKDFLYYNYIVLKKDTNIIAREVGCSNESIRRYLIKHNITRRTRSEYQIGTKRSNITKTKMSLASKGKQKSLTHKLKCVENLKLRKPGYAKRAGKKIKALWKNKEFRDKMLIIRKKQMTPEVIAKISKQLEKREITSLEKNIQDICIEYNLPFRYCGAGGTYIRGRSPDFIDTVGKKLIIEVFYEYFKIKQYGSVRKYRLLRRAIFQKDGYRTLFLAHNNLQRLSKSQIADKIKNFIWR